MTLHIGDIVRTARHAGRLRDAIACSRCGVAWREALVPGEPVVCAECDARERGIATTELHHLAGRASSNVTIRIGVNEHRILTTLQRAWPSETLRNISRDPRLVRAAWFRGIADLLVLRARAYEYDYHYGENHESS